MLASDLAELGRDLVRQQKWAEAEPVLRESLEIREAKLRRQLGDVSYAGRAGGELGGAKEVFRGRAASGEWL